MRNPVSRVETMDLLGEELCLDLANTVDWHASDHPEDTLLTYADLVAWSRRAGILTEPQAKALLHKAARHPAEADAVLKRGVAVREAIYRTLIAAMRYAAPEPTDLHLLNDELARALAQARLVPSDKSYRWDWNGDLDALDRMLWPIVRSAAEVLTSNKLHRVGQCADDRGCGWLFLDTSRNHSRRWCDIKGCGNRAKAQRHYERSKHVRG